MVLHFLRTSPLSSQVSAGILQAPVSDREYMVWKDAEGVKRWSDASTGCICRGFRGGSGVRMKAEHVARAAERRTCLSVLMLLGEKERASCQKFVYQPF